MAISHVLPQNVASGLIPNIDIKVNDRRMEMTLHECPGPNRKKPNIPVEVHCPHCGAEIEIWSHDTMIKCPSCLKEMPRDETGESGSHEE